MTDNLALVSNSPRYKPSSKQRARSFNITTLPAYIWSPYDIKRGSEVRRYDKPSRHPVFKTALNTLLAGVFWPATEIASNNNYTNYPQFEDIDKEVVKLINDTLDQLSNETFNNIIQGIVTDAMVYGYSVAELVWEKRGKQNVLTAIKIKPPYNFDAWTNSTDDIEALYYNPGYTGGDSIFLDPRGFIYAIYPRYEHGNPFGESEIMSIEQDILVLQKLEETRVKTANLLAVKPILHYFEAEKRSKNETQAAIQAIRNLESGAIAHLPARWNDDGTDLIYSDKIEIPEDRASKDAILDLGSMILQYEKRITRALGIPDDLGQTTVAAGSYAKSNVEFDIFTSKVQRVQEWICDVINKQVIKPIIEYNFGNIPEGYQYPLWRFAETSDAYKLDELQYYKSAIEAGILNPMEPHIRERLGEPSLTRGLNVERTT